MSHIKSKKMFHKTASNIKITDQFMCGLVKHFFSDVHIEDDKYLINIASKMWNKKQEISQALAVIGEGEGATASLLLTFSNTITTENMGLGSGPRRTASAGSGGGSDDIDSDSDNGSKMQPPVSPHMTIYNAYERYCSYSYLRKAHVASKRYFEKYYDVLQSSVNKNA
jgi:hypothetical protein